MAHSIDYESAGETPGRGKGHGPYARIRDAIVSGAWKPNAPLVEASLAKRYGVSRTPVREALLRLEQDGLVVRGPHGLVVRDQTPEQILDLYETMTTLEVMAARVAAERHNDIDRVRMEQAAKRCESVDTNDRGDVVERNREFHRTIWIASHNEALVDLLNRVNGHLMRYPSTTLTYPGRWDEALREHKELLQAISVRDQSGASLIAEGHFARARDLRLRMWEDGSQDSIG